MVYTLEIIYFQIIIQGRQPTMFLRRIQLPLCTSVLLVLLSQPLKASVSDNSYATIIDDFAISPASASLAGADLSVGNGVSVNSTPANLPFDSMHHLALSYAGFFNNTFSTSLLAYNGKPAQNIGVSILAGYVYIPEIMNTTQSEATPDGQMRTAKISYFSASKMLFRAGVGRRIPVSHTIDAGVGVALNAKRVRLPDLGYGTSVDAGARMLYKPLGASVAVNIENLTSSYTIWNKNYKERGLQRCYAGIGAEQHIPYIYGNIRLMYTTPDLFANSGINDVSKETTENDNIIETADHTELYEKPSLLFTNGKLGIEYTAVNTIAFRLGLTRDQIAFGAGLRLKNDRAGVDVAYLSHAALSGTYQLSLNYNW